MSDAERQNASQNSAEKILTTDSRRASLRLKVRKEVRGNSPQTPDEDANASNDAPKLERSSTALLLQEDIKAGKLDCSVTVFVAGSPVKKDEDSKSTPRRKSGRVGKKTYKAEQYESLNKEDKENSASPKKKEEGSSEQVEIEPAAGANKAEKEQEPANKEQNEPEEGTRKQEEKLREATREHGEEMKESAGKREEEPEVVAKEQDEKLGEVAKEHGEEPRENTSKQEEEPDKIGIGESTSTCEIETVEPEAEGKKETGEENRKKSRKRKASYDAQKDETNTSLIIPVPNEDETEMREVRDDTTLEQPSVKRMRCNIM